jgi:hypothetical protein
VQHVVNRRQFISDSIKVLIGAGIGAVATKSLENYASSATEPLIGNRFTELPLNPNGDFSEGEKYWEPHISPGLPTSKWGYHVVTNQFGQVWIDNPLVGKSSSANDHVAMYQDFNCVKSAGIEKSDLMLRGRSCFLEADVRVDEDVEEAPAGFARAAIAFALRKPDDSCYNIGINTYGTLYTELDFYRRNDSYIGGPPSDNFTYPTEQIPLGSWKHHRIDVTDYITNGFNGHHGWGEKTYNESMLWAWYLVVEVQGSRSAASWRSVKLWLG